MSLLKGIGIALAILVIIAIIAPGPKFGIADMHPSEAAVIRHIQTIHQAQTQYRSQFGRFATNLSELGPPTAGAPGPQAADLIPASLASGDKDGYTFLMTATPAGYTMNVNPKVYNGTGRRTFFSDQSMVIRQNWSQEPATINSPEMK